MIIPLPAAACVAHQLLLLVTPNIFQHISRETRRGASVASDIIFSSSSSELHRYRDQQTHSYTHTLHFVLREGNFHLALIASLLVLLMLLFVETYHL